MFKRPILRVCLVSLLLLTYSLPAEALSPTERPGLLAALARALPFLGLVVTVNDLSDSLDPNGSPNVEQPTPRETGDDENLGPSIEPGDAEDIC